MAGKKKSSRSAIEEAIRSDPSDPAPYLVLADLLQAEGDPRGELIALQSELAGDEERQRQREEALLERHAATLLGPLHDAIAALGPLPGREVVALEWRRGFLRRIRLRVRDRGPALVGVARALVASPSAAFLEAFEAEVTMHGDELAEFQRVLATGLPATLRELVLSTGYMSAIDMAALWPRVPDLRVLRLLSLGDTPSVIGDLAPLSKLEVLELHAIADRDVRALTAVPPPRLTSLELRCEDDAVAYEALLAGALPRLHHLGLGRRWARVDAERVVLPPALTSLRLAAVAISTLKRAVGAAAHLRSLDVTFHDYAGKDTLRRLFALPLRELGLGAGRGMQDYNGFIRCKLLPRLERLVVREAEDHHLASLVRDREKLAHLRQLEVRDAYKLDRDTVREAHAALPNLRVVPQLLR